MRAIFCHRTDEFVHVARVCIVAHARGVALRDTVNVREVFVRRHALWLVVLAAGTVQAAPKKLKAAFLCGTFVDGKIKQPLTGGKVAKLTDPIACAIHVPDPAEPSHMGHVHTVRRPAGGKPIVATGKTEDFGSQSEAKDFEVVLAPNAPDASGDVAWKPCEDFDIVASISDDLGTYFSKTIKVQQKCPKPAPVAAALTCSYEAQDGTLFRWPGTGDKVKPRLSAPEHTLSCSITVKAKATPRDGLPLVGHFAIGKGADHPGEASEGPPDGDLRADAGFSGEAGDFQECETFTIQASLVDATGATRWTGKRTITQTCGD